MPVYKLPKLKPLPFWAITHPSNLKQAVPKGDSAALLPQLEALQYVLAVINCNKIMPSRSTTLPTARPAKA